ncbi:MAG: hypothetical protein ACRDRX_13305 [Pseudonocardiaceae bacterium]
MGDVGHRDETACVHHARLDRRDRRSRRPRRRPAQPQALRDFAIAWTVTPVVAGLIAVVVFLLAR